MKNDQYGRVILDEDEIFETLYSNKNLVWNKIYTTDIDLINQFNSSIDSNADSISKINLLEDLNISVEEYDRSLQSRWFLPDSYSVKNLNIEEWLFLQCNNNTEKQRVIEELKLFNQHQMIPLLNYLKYLVDTLRKHNIVWGVGRGSSVSSYCLYLIGIHKINSLEYELDINEFLK